MAELVTIARPYAKAAFKAAMDAGTVESWQIQVSLLAMIAEDPRIKALLNNPKVLPQKRAELILQVAGQKVAEPLQRLIKIMSDNNRLQLLPALKDLYELYAADWAKRIQVEVFSARPLNDSQKERMKKALAKRLERDVIMQYSVDQSLLGGALIKAGDMVIDGSAKGKLAKLAESLQG